MEEIRLNIISKAFIGFLPSTVCKFIGIGYNLTLLEMLFMSPAGKTRHGSNKKSKGLRLKYVLSIYPMPSMGLVASPGERFQQEGHLDQPEGNSKWKDTEKRLPRYLLGWNL